MKNKTRILTAAAAVLLLAGTAMAQPGGMSGDRTGNRNMERQGQAGNHGDVLQRMRPLLETLDLTEEQKTEISDIMEETRNTVEAIMETEEPGNHRGEFLELFASSGITTSQVENLLSERLSTMEEINGIIAGAIVDVHNVLTADQLETLASLDINDIEMRRGGHGEEHDSRGSGMNRESHSPR